EPLAVQRANTVIAVAALRAQIDQLRRGIESASAKLDDLKSQIRDTTPLTLAAFSPDSHVVRLAGMPPAPKASATLAYSRSHRTCLFEAAGLPAAPADKIYGVWWIGQHSGPMKAGLFRPNPQGMVRMGLAMPPEGEQMLASAVTLEPSGGTEKPTGSMYLKGDFPH